MDWASAIGGLIVGAATTGVPALVQFLRARAELSHAARVDALDEWKALHDQTKADLAAVKSEMETIRAEHSECLVRSAAMAQEIVFLKAAIEQLKAERNR